MSLFSLLNIARDGLQAQSAGVTVSGQNVTNANTPGYVRRRVLLETRTAGSGSDGGVNYRGIQRTFNSLAFGRVVVEHGRQGAASARAAALNEVQATVTPTSGTIADRVNSFFAAFDSLSATPSDTSARLAVLQQASALADQVSGTANDLQTQRADLLTQAQGVAGEVNQRLERIATLNTQIAEATGRGDAGADLRDQRDLLVQEVSDRIGARSIEDSKGQVTLFAAGTVLVEGGNASSISVNLDPANNLQLMVQHPGGAAVDATTGLTEGTLGGIREARDTDIPATQTSLDQFAFDLSNTVNAAHAAGFGLDGVTGRNLFTAPAVVAGAARNMAVNAAVAGQPERIAASATAADLPGGNAVALQIANFATSALGAGTSTPSSRVASIESDVGVRVQAATNEQQLRDDTVHQAETLRDSSEGVSLDEEMANLSQFQRAFEASTRVLQVADQLLAGLLAPGAV